MVDLTAFSNPPNIPHTAVPKILRFRGGPRTFFRPPTSRGEGARTAVALAGVRVGVGLGGSTPSCGLQEKNTPKHEKSASKNFLKRNIFGSLSGIYVWGFEAGKAISLFGRVKTPIGRNIL